MTNKLDYYLRLWNLSDPQLLAKTPTSHIYTVISSNEQVVLKLLTPIGVHDEINGAIALRHFDGFGAIRLLQDDEGAHLLEYADQENLKTLVEQGKDEQATKIIAQVLTQLHSAKADTLPNLTPLRVRFRSLFGRAETDNTSNHAAQVVDKLLATPHDVRVLHGDIHHENICRHSERGWLAFDPKGLVGERTYDAANVLCNPYGMPEVVENEVRLLKTIDILVENAAFDRARLLAFVFCYACLNASWSLESGDDPTHALRIAEIVEPHVEF
jgi:streptomycin 6-kinase